MRKCVPVIFAGLVLNLVLCSDLNDNAPDMIAERCGICHGLPPADSNHTGIGELDCAVCHKGNSQQTHTTGPSHANGVVDLVFTRCDLCHEAPPENEYHRVHVDSLHYDCNSCHEGNSIKTNSASRTHRNGSTDVVFAAKFNPKKTASFDSAQQQCNSVYCHGAFDQGTNASVKFPVSGTIHNVCDACHDTAAIFISHAKHPGDTVDTRNCGTCHSGYSSAVIGVANRFVNDSIHVDGVTQATGCCYLCHTGWKKSVHCAE